MKVLITIPHFYEAGSDAHGALARDPSARILAFQKNLISLHQNFSQPQGIFDITRSEIYEVNQTVAVHLDVAILTTGEKHLLGHVTIPDRISFCHHPTDAESKLLGFECLKLHQKHLGEYDFHCYVEDDLLLVDPWFFRKLTWFNDCFGNDKVLMPNRFETSNRGPFNKVYVDGNLGRQWIEPFQDLKRDPIQVAKFLGTEVRFMKLPNPIGPGFYLNAHQFAEWERQPYFLDYDQRFIGPIESAYTLGVLKTFQIYKSAPANAAFLEVEHLDNRYLDKRLAFD